MSTVNISLLDICGVAVACDVIFKPVSTPFITGNTLAVSGSRSVRTATDGTASTTLEPGVYTVTFTLPVNTDALTIGVPADSATYDLTSLIGAGTTLPNPPRLVGAQGPQGAQGPAVTSMASVAISDSTVAGRALLTAANAAAQRAALGLPATASVLAPNDGLISGYLALWLKPDVLTGGGQTDGSPVTLWYDSSGRNNHATAGSSTAPIFYAPAMGPRLIGGQPSILFSSSAQLYFTLANTIHLTEFTLFVVVRALPGNTFICLGNSAGSFQLATTTRDSVTDETVATTYNGATGITANSSSRTLASPMIIEVVQSDSGNTQSIRGNGLLLSTGTSGSTYVSGTDGDGNPIVSVGNAYQINTVGALPGIAYSDADMSELIVFNVALTDLQCQGVREYLQNVYFLH